MPSDTATSYKPHGKLGHPPKWHKYMGTNRMSRVADVPVDPSLGGKLNLPNLFIT